MSMTDETTQTPWGPSGVVLAALAAVTFSLSSQRDGELTVVLWAVGAVLLAGGLFAAYRA